MNSIKKEIKKFYLKFFYFIKANYINIYRTLILKLNTKNIKTNNKISLLCPSRQRVNKTNRFLDSLYNKSNNLDNLELLILLDEDEKDELGYIKLIEKYNKIKNIITIHKKNFETNSDRMNFLASISTGEILLGCNDDMIFITPEWDTLLNYEFSKAKNNEPFSVWLRCDRKYTYLDASAFPAVNRCWFNKLDHLAYHKFRNWYLDTWICELGRKTNFYIVSNKIKVKQFHAINLKDEIDDTHTKNHTKENIEHDDLIWQQTKKLRDSDVSKLINTI
tara:strand:+ start:98 stop:928 length:831 start_codon:yes stop_codon:yes gene_type:complete